LLFAIVSITMSNKVWVTWKDPATGKVVASKVYGLEDNADVDDLRIEFLAKRPGLELDPAHLEIFATQDGGKLDEGKELKEYFTNSAGSLSLPGKSKATALIVMFPPQQQQNGKLRCCFCIHFCIQFVVRIRK
jgi:hypothetical protein